jgi:hypothetical protein
LRFGIEPKPAPTIESPTRNRVAFRLSLRHALMSMQHADLCSESV